MEHVFEYRAIVSSRDVDGMGRCRPSALLGHLQEAATGASEAHGFSRKQLLAKYGAVWMLARVRYELARPLRWEEELTVSTWHRGSRLGSLYRDFDLAVGGEPVGRAISLWALVDVERRKILSVARVPELADSAVVRPDRQEQLARLRPPQPMEETERRLMRYSDADINGHVNNTRYADFACDVIRADTLPPDEFIRAMQIGYTAECRPGETVVMSAAAQGARRFILGADEAGKERFCVQLDLDKEGAKKVK